MISVQRRTDGQTFVSRRGVDVSTAEWRAVESFAVGNAVKRAPSRHDEMLAGNLLVKVVEKMKKDFFEAMLQCECQIHITLCDFGVRLARLPKQRLHAIGEVAGEANRSVRKNLHTGIAAERLEVTEI